MPKLACLLLLLFALPADAQEWTRFRGPNGDGVSHAANVPIKWTEKDYRWNASLPGVGHSSPVFWGDRVFITSADPETGTLFILCLSTDDGRELWRREILGRKYHHHLRNSLATSTPTVDARRLYVAHATPEHFRVLAFNHDGRPLWEQDLGPFAAEHGFGTSPILYEDLVVINNDNDAESSLVALDKSTGKIRWRVPRETDKVAYSTPCERRLPDGRTELIFNSGAHGISGVDPATGRTNWELQVFDKRSVSSPIVAAGLVFGSCGSGGGGNYVVAVRPGDDGAKPEEVYRVAKSAPYVPTSVAWEDLVFLWSDQGVATCIDAADGRIRWQKRIGGNFSGSPICVAGRLYCISDDGEVVVLAASPDYQLLARNPLGEASRATPAVAGGRLYLRTVSHLICIGGE